MTDVEGRAYQRPIFIFAITVMSILIIVTLYKCWKQNRTINHPTFLLGGEDTEEKPENEELKPDEPT